MGLFSTREADILEAHKKLVFTPHLFGKEEKNLISEYLDLKSSVEKIGIALNSLKNGAFAGDRRDINLSPLFIAINGAVKECRKERNLGKDKFFEKFAKLVENLEGVLLNFRKSLLDKKDIMDRDRAVRIYLEHIHGKLREALDELKKDIKIEAQRARTAVKGTLGNS